MYDIKLSAVTCFVILSSFNLTQNAFAESKTSLSKRVIEEIVVTAERRESFVQSTPMAFNSLGTEDREELGLRNISPGQSKK